jgi:hypothetical protein
LVHYRHVFGFRLQHTDRHDFAHPDVPGFSSIKAIHNLKDPQQELNQGGDGMRQMATLCRKYRLLRIPPLKN